MTVHPPASSDAMPVHDLPFERLLDLSEFATRDTPHRFDVFAGGLSMPDAPVRILGADGVLRDGEMQYRSALPPVSLYSLPGHILGGGGAARGHGAGRSIFWREDCIPNYFRDAFAPPQDADAEPADRPPHEWAGSLGDPAAEVVDYDFPIATVVHRNSIYGHALLEMLPKAWLIGQLARMGRKLHVALDADAPAWLTGLIGVFVPPERIIRYDARRQVLRAPTIVVPSMMQLDYYLHPAFNLLVEDMLDRVLGTGPRPDPVRRLFLSRSGLGDLSMMANAEAFEHRLAAAGFEILRPETMRFDEQLRAYAGARVIVSEYGSATHNALFAPIAGTHVVINRINGLQERIAALRGQSIGFVEPQGGWIKRVNADRSTWRRAAIDPEAVLRLIETMERPSTPAGQPAPIPVTRETMVVEGYVTALDDGGDKPVLAPMTEVALPAFVCHEPVDPAIAPFARLFQPNAPRSYTAQPVLCARLGGASLLGDSGLVVWRGKIPNDTADRADWARAAGIELAAGPNGRPAPVAFDKRSHPGRALYQAFTGRWLDDAAFLVECLPRLVAYTRLTGPGTVAAAVLPASPPGSIQQRALDLLGVPGIETIGPDQVVTGSTVWLPSGIDPWQPTPLVVEAARALADRVPPAQVPTPRRLYLRAPRDARPPLRGFEALVPVLARHGFEAVTLAEHDLDTRIRLMRGAEIVVTEAAAGSAHVMFCRPGAQILELFNPVFVQPSTYTLAALAGLGFGFLVGRHIPDPGFEQPSLASAYTISPERLDAALGALPRADVAPPPMPQAAPMHTPAPVAAPSAPPPPVAAIASGTFPRPFFAAPALPDQARAPATIAVVARSGVAIDGHGTVRQTVAGDTAIPGDVIATLSPAGVDPLLGALPRLIAARLLREKNPEARIVLPLSGPVRRLAELLGLIDGSVVLTPDAAVTAERLWVVDGLEQSPETMPPELFRRAGEALRDALPVTDAESMGLIPSRILICASQPDAMLENALSAHGFVAVGWTGLSVDEQVRIMRTARLVVLEPGHAACLVLARPGARVLEAGHPTARGLAAVCGLDYGCIGDAGALDAAVEALVG